MEVTANITKWDVANLYLHWFFRFKYLALLVIFIFVSCAIFYPHKTFYDYQITLIVAIVGGGFSVLVGLLMSLAHVYLISPFIGLKGLGKHIYTISDNGLYEKAPTNERLDKWTEILSIEKSQNYIYVRVPNLNFLTPLFHAIPRRNFKNKDEFYDFYYKATRYWKEAFNN